MFNNGGQPLNGSGTQSGSTGIGTGTWAGPNGGFPILPIGPAGGTQAFADPVTGELPVNVEPGTYSVCYTYTSPQGCVATPACTDVTVLPFACEVRTGPRPDEVWGPDPGSTIKTLSGGGGTYPIPPGIYYVTCPVVLTYGHFEVAPGTVFLFDAGTSLTLADEGRLTAYSTRFTAACDQMWDGIIVKATSGGLYLGDPSSDLYGALPGLKPYGGGIQYGEVSHAQTGVSWEDPSATPVRLVATHFFNNLIGLQAGVYPQNVFPVVHPLSAVVNCVFDADPQLFKRTPGGLLYADWLSLVHLDLNGWSYADPVTGILMPIEGNRLADAMLGLIARHQVDPFTLTLGKSNLFENNRVMGMGIPTLTHSVDLGTNTQFVLPPASRDYQPSLRLRTATESYYPWLATAPVTPLNPQQAWGAWFGWHGRTAAQPTITVNGATFEPFGGEGPFGNATYPRTGLEVEQAKNYYRVTNCTFTNLRTGLRLGLKFSGEDCEVAGNTFHNCGRGIAVRNAYPNTPPAFPTPVFWPRCNTFSRDAPTGNSVGILIEPGAANVPAPVFDDYSRYSAGLPYRIPMQNWFNAQRQVTSGTFLYLNNQSGQGFTYTGFTGINSNSNPNAAITLLSGSAGLANPNNSQGPINFQLIFGGRTAYDENFDACGLSGYYLTGFNRGAPSVTDPAPPDERTSTTVGESAPNPASESTEISYRLAEVRTAELVVRDVVSGRVMRRQSLDVAANHAHLSVAGLSAGVYTYSVVADGVVIGTRKLVVGR